MKARLIALLAGLGAVLALAVVFSNSNVAAEGGKCSVHGLKGSYAARISGWFGSGPSRTPYAEVGAITLDGEGGITGTSTFSFNGVIGAHVITGTYTVDSEMCTGEAVTSIGTFFFAIADNATETRIISTVPGATVDGDAIKR